MSAATGPMLALLALPLLAALGSGLDGQAPAAPIPVARAVADLDGDLRAHIDNLCAASELIVEGEVLEWHRIPLPGLSKSERSRVWGVLHVTHPIWGYDAHDAIAIVMPATPRFDTSNKSRSSGIWFLERSEWPADASASEKTAAEKACGAQIWSAMRGYMLGCALSAADGTLSVRSCEVRSRVWRIDHDTLVKTIDQSLAALPCGVTANLCSSALLVSQRSPVIVQPDSTCTCAGKPQPSLSPAGLKTLNDALRDNHFETLPAHIGESYVTEAVSIILEVRDARGAARVSFGGFLSATASSLERDMDARMRRILAAIPIARDWFPK